mgnify:CR=1 FL=1
MQAPPERLGSFYLGAEYDLETGQRLDAPVNYDARDLTTHAVCIGMTGSGKTGLCIGLLEEAALDKVPTLLIDPKGDITNLLLQFPELRPADFEPWVNPDDARRKGQTVADYAQTTAGLWRNGLAEWGISPERIAQLQETIDYTIYTPGSDAGIPVSILGSLAAPGLDFEENAEALRERIGGTVAALLGLVGIAADPIRSREAILLANIFEHFWRQNQDLDLAQLIMAIQNPPFRKLGVFEIDAFYPEKERFQLAMTFNGLIASPSFQSWISGDALDIDRLLYTAEGKPRHSIFYIAHLSDSERMFFVTLLLENVLTWVRRQSGTTSLRALLYFDEVFGFLPPTAEPPSKRPLLTLLKQARAFGLGCILVTQNPVDLDYKGLTNTGTWFIGKLQAERDKARVLEGLKGAISQAGGAGEQLDYNTVLSKLGSRLFLLHNVHEERPIIFQTRWAMSYLRGPLTKPQVRALTEARQPTVAPETTAPPKPQPHQPVISSAAAPAPATGPATPTGFSDHPPTLDPAVAQLYLPIELSEQAAIRQLSQDTGREMKVAGVQLIYESAVVGVGEIRFADRQRNINQSVEKMLLLPIPEKARHLDWQEAETLTLTLKDLKDKPEPVGQNQGPFFGPVPELVNSAAELKELAKSLVDWLYYNSRLTINVHKELKLFQESGESERAFKIRLQQAARENRDAEVDKLEATYEKQLARLAERLRKEQQALAKSEAQYGARKQEELIGVGESVLGFFLGRRRSGGRALSQIASKRRLTGQAKLSFEETKEEIAKLQEEKAKLEAELKEQADEITRKWADLLDDITSEEIAPRRTDINVRLVALAWLPSWLIAYDDSFGSRSATIAAYPLPESS